MAILAAGVAVYNLLHWVFRKRTILYSGDGTPVKDKPYSTLVSVIRTISLVSGFMVGVVFLINENMSQPMVFVNANTPLILLFVAVNAVTLLFTFWVMHKRNVAELALQNERDENIEQWLNDGM